MNSVANNRPLSTGNPFGARRGNVPLVSLPVPTQLVARALANQPEYRSTPIGMIAQRRGVPAHVMRAAAAAVLGSARDIAAGRGVRLCPCPSIERQIDMRKSMDQLLAEHGSDAAAPVSSPSPMRRGQLHVPHPVVMASLLESTPLARRSPIVRAQLQAARAGSTAQFAWRDAGALMDAGELYASAPDYQWFHVVKAGSGPRSIANYYTGDENRFTELLAANPEKATVGTPGSLAYNFKSLLVGEKIKIPKSWNIYVAQDGTVGKGGSAFPPAPATPPPVPSPPASDGSYVSTLAAGQVTAIKLQLGQWGKDTGAIVPSGYPTTADIWVGDAVDESFLQAVRSFQQWSNAKKGTSLPTDGRFTAATHAALNAYTAGKAGGTATPATPYIPTSLPPATPATPGTPAVPIPVPGVPGTTPVAKKSSGSGALAALALAAVAAVALAS